MQAHNAMLPKEAVIEYQQIYKEKCHVGLSFEEAESKANNFIKLMALVTGTSMAEDDGKSKDRL